MIKSSLSTNRHDDSLFFLQNNVISKLLFVLYPIFCTLYHSFVFVFWTLLIWVPSNLILPFDHIILSIIDFRVSATNTTRKNSSSLLTQIWQFYKNISYSHTYQLKNKGIPEIFKWRKKQHPKLTVFHPKYQPWFYVGELQVCLVHPKHCSWRPKCQVLFRTGLAVVLSCCLLKVPRECWDSLNSSLVWLLLFRYF